MKYEFILDKENYLLGFQKSDKGIEFNPLSVNLVYLNCYKLEDDKVVLDEEKLSVVKEEESKNTELTSLKQFLIDTSDTANDFVEEVFALDNPLTFVTDLIALIVQYRTKYKTILAQRKQARERIKELEK